MENTDLYDTMIQIAGDIKDKREQETALQRDINMFVVMQKQREAKIMGEICGETISFEVPGKKDEPSTWTDKAKYTNQAQRDAEVLVRLGSDAEYHEWSQTIQAKTEDRSKLLQAIDHKEMLYKAALSQNQREAKSVTILSQKTVVLQEPQ